MAKIRKCVYPYPTYEAHYMDGTYARMSVWQPKDKPWDFERFRRVLQQPMPGGCHVFMGPPAPIVDGYLEHISLATPKPGVPYRPSLRMRDPLFSGAEVVTPKRKPWRGSTEKQKTRRLSSWHGKSQLD
jgi:hypothetical protein